MADQRARTVDSFPWIPPVRGGVVFVLMVSLSLSILSAGGTSGDQNAVRMRRITTPTYVSLVIENRRAYDVTVTLTIYPENAQVTRIVPETATCGGR
jgi:hypothetical protein